MNTPQIILNQLGGNHFVVMTGATQLVGDGNTLRMKLPKNYSKANRLWVTLDADDTYTMRFFHYVAPRLNNKTFEFTKEKVQEVKKYEGIYCDQLRELFEQTTHMYTSL